MEAGNYFLEIRKDGFQTYREKIALNVGLDNIKNIYLYEKNIKVENSSEKIIWFVIIFLFLGIVFMVLLIFLALRKPEMVKGGLQGNFDQYKLLSIIGKGGMATIYKAKDIKSGRLVALKVLDLGYINDKDIVKKFLKEGEILRLIHQKSSNAPVVKLYKYGRENEKSTGRPFIALELLEGIDLLKYIRKNGKIPQHIAFKIISTICDALYPAHQLGIYHRDLSPDNIILLDHALKRNEFNSKGIRLIDFGIARHEYTSIGTLDGSIAGKPPFMSPEQCKGKKVDERSDIYSLGIIFYTLLTGTPPFVSPNPLEVMKMHENAEVKYPSGFPQYLIPIINRMLAKDPEERFQNVYMLKGNLKNFGNFE